MSPCIKGGVFVWPPRDDIQEVNSEFIIEFGLVPECVCVSSGRQWLFTDHVKYQELYEDHKELFF